MDWNEACDKLIELTKEVNRLTADNQRMRAALDRIAHMDDIVYAKGMFCSKIAREALDAIRGKETP